MVAPRADTLEIEQGRWSLYDLNCQHCIAIALHLRSRVSPVGADATQDGFTTTVIRIVSLGTMGQAISLAGTILGRTLPRSFRRLSSLALRPKILRPNVHREEKRVTASRHGREISRGA